MNISSHPHFILLCQGILTILVVSSTMGYYLRRRLRADSSEKQRTTIQNLNDRINAWWVMCGVILSAIAIGYGATIIFFALISFLGLREFITLTPTKPADHRTLFWIFFIFTPLQYLLIYQHWYGLFSIFIPVYVFLLIPLRIVLSGDYHDFLARTAKIQWGMMICTYCISYAPALLTLSIPHYEGQQALLLIFMILIVQLSDVLQYVWGKLIGKRPIAPKISPNKTWEGFWGGILSASLIGTSLYWITPFQAWQAGIISFIITLAGFAGGLCMSAIKRDRGVKDFGSLIEGHGGVMDRIDSICFAAPIFFHITRYFFT